MRGVKSRTSRIRPLEAGRSAGSRVRRFRRLRSAKAIQKRLAERTLSSGDRADPSYSAWPYGPQLRRALDLFALTPEVALLLQLVAQDCDTPTLLSEHLRMTPLRITPLLSELELRGLVLCQRELGKEPRTYLYSTEAGRKLSSRIQKAITRLQGSGAGGRQRTWPLPYRPAARNVSRAAFPTTAAQRDRSGALSRYLAPAPLSGAARS